MARGETCEKFGELVGLPKSKVSEMERGLFKPSVKVALKIEAISEGRISAADIHADVRLARHGLPDADRVPIDALGRASGQ